jgi:ParB-like chromosome segregation protein Spo0J
VLHRVCDEGGGTVLSLFASTLDDIKDAIHNHLSAMGTAERIAAINELRGVLHELSPFRSEPVDFVQWVPAEQVTANDYNPNAVAPPEMRLLYTSIREDGFTQPIVSSHDTQNKQYIVVDGFHRNRVGKERRDIKERIHGYLPIVVIDKPLEERMASTIRHNRARGKHAVTPMSDLVATLYRGGWADDRIAKELGMELDEVLRLKQITGLPEIFADREYSRAWE